MWPNPQKTAGLVKFNEENLNSLNAKIAII